MECSLTCKHREKNNQQCDGSCHPRGCQCGSCPTGHCGVSTHPRTCRCGEFPEKKLDSWHGIAE
jgi:hypothetical protein